MLNRFDTRRFHGPAGVCLAVSAALFVGACGGGGGGSTTAAHGGTTVSKAEFDSAANAICKQGDRELTRTALRAFAGQNATASQREQYATRTGIPIVERMISKLRALPAPPNPDRFNAIFAAADQEIAAVKQNPSTFGDQAFARTDKLAHAYGLPDC